MPVACTVTVLDCLCAANCCQNEQEISPTQSGQQSPMDTQYAYCGYVKRYTQLCHLYGALKAHRQHTYSSGTLPLVASGASSNITLKQ
jgi:hypothetical protein